MVIDKDDPKIICDRKPSRLTQDCLSELLTKLKGKLRKKDLYEVYAYCHADPLQDMRDCLVRGMTVEWNSPSYKPARAVGNVCHRSRKNLVKRRQTIRQLESSSGAGLVPKGTQTKGK